MIARIPLTRPILTRPFEKPESVSCQPIFPECSDNDICWPNQMEQHTPEPTVVSNPLFVERVSATGGMKPMHGTMTLKINKTCYRQGYRIHINYGFAML